MTGLEELFAELERLRRRVDYLETAEAVASTPAPVYAAVHVTAVDYTLTNTDNVVIFTATGKTATLPAATGSGLTYRIALEVGSAASLTIDANGAETIKGATTQTLYDGEDLIITDYASGKWA